MTLPDYLRPKVVFKKFDDSATYFTYDSFAPPGSGPRVIECYVEDRFNQAAPFEVRIEDNTESLDPNVGEGNHVYISIGATQPTLIPYVAGFIREVDVDRLDTGVLEYVMRGWTNPIRFEELLVNYFRFANRAANGEDPDLSDTTVQADELFKAVIESIDVRPFGGPLVGFTTSGVQAITEKIVSIKQPFVTMKEVLDRIAETVGAIYGVDGSNDAFLRYATLEHSGITIRDSDPAGVVVPEATNGYFVGPWRYKRSIRKSDGFANRLLGRGGTQMHLDVDEWTDNGQDEVYTVDRAMQFVAKAPSLDVAGVILSRTGTIADDITGEILYDDADSPTGDIVAGFTIFKDLLNNVTVGQATGISRLNISMHKGSMQVGSKYWIRLKLQGDASNHYRWHHDNGSSGRNATYDGVSWTVNPSSKTYTHRTYCSRRVIMTWSHPVSTNKYGVTEQPVDAPWILEARAMHSYLDGLGRYTSQRKLKFEPRTIYAPTTPIFSGKLVRLIDSKSGLDIDAEILKAAYHFKASENGIGTRNVTLDPIGFLP